MNFLPNNDIDLDRFFAATIPRGEYLGIAKLSNDEIALPSTYHGLHYIRNFFNWGVYQPPAIKCDISVDEYSTPEVQQWQHGIETYCKYAWLAKEYLENSGFNDLLGAHWNPSEGKYIIHPGGSRQVIHKLFGPAEATFLLFNTTGVHVDWIKRYTSKEQFFEDYDKDTTYAVFCNEHGTLIPHIHNGAAGIPEAVFATHKKCQTGKKVRFAC